jgi:hypothetical protein
MIDYFRKVHLRTETAGSAEPVTEWEVARAARRVADLLGAGSSEAVTQAEPDTADRTELVAYPLATDGDMLGP